MKTTIIYYTIDKDTFETEVISDIGYYFGTKKHTNIDDARLYVTQIMKSEYAFLKHWTLKEVDKNDSEFLSLIEFSEMMGEIKQVHISSIQHRLYLVKDGIKKAIGKWLFRCGNFIDKKFDCD